MSKSFIRMRQRVRRLITVRQLETGFSMLEAVVVVGVLLALAVSGFFAYGPITENAKRAAVKSAATSVHTAVTVAIIDGDPTTIPDDVIKNWNNSNDKIKVKIVDSGAVIAAMTTAAVTTAPSDVCVQATQTESPDISAQAGTCPVSVVAPVPSATPTPTPTVTPTPTPTVTPPAPPAAVTTGDLVGWGINNQGNLGTGDTTNSSIPRATLTSGVLSGKKMSAVSGGGGHTCAVADGAAYCWGWGNVGQLGSGNISYSSAPLAVTTSGALAGKTITSISSGNNNTCAVASGAAYCWGENTYGQLGNNTTVNAGTPVAVNTLGVLSGKTVTAISAGFDSTCAVADGAVYCWGRNPNGQLGNNSTVNSSIPVAVTTTGVLSGKTITDVSVGRGFACATAAGLSYCWGAGTNGQLGNNVAANSSVPVAVVTSGVLSGKTITSISAGDFHVCVVASGAAYCWGMNGSGPLGTNDRVNSLVPIAVVTSGVLSGKTIKSISAGNSHTCAVANDGIYCWGYNYYGTVGNGTTGSAVYAPVVVSPSVSTSGKTALFVEAGAQHTMAIYG